MTCPKNRPAVTINRREAALLGQSPLRERAARRDACVSFASIVTRGSGCCSARKPAKRAGRCD